jgi:hypothetical protein
MVIIKCDCFIKPDQHKKFYDMILEQAANGIILLPPQFTLLSAGQEVREGFVGLVAKSTPGIDPGTAYVETSDGLRLIFHDGKYAGWFPF